MDIHLDTSVKAIRVNKRDKLFIMKWWNGTPIMYQHKIWAKDIEQANIVASSIKDWYNKNENTEIWYSINEYKE